MLKTLHKKTALSVFHVGSDIGRKQTALRPCLAASDPGHRPLLSFFTDPTDPCVYNNEICQYFTF